MERLNNCNLKKNNRATNAVCGISIDLQLIHVLACNVFILIMKCHLWEVLWFLTKRIVWLTLYVSISWVWHVNDLEFIMIPLHADLDNQHIKIDNLCVFVIKNMLLIYFSIFIHSSSRAKRNAYNVYSLYKATFRLKDSKIKKYWTVNWTKN